mmetsp:Transcript_10042/g.20758  ORF Transcript_10042/g.20758 Transcript_10042/m.20758 type:complete len:82 (+) Transcript_10042:879-1124(+)
MGGVERAKVRRSEVDEGGVKWVDSLVGSIMEEVEKVRLVVLMDCWKRLGLRILRKWKRELGDGICMDQSMIYCDCCQKEQQ